MKHLSILSKLGICSSILVNIIGITLILLLYFNNEDENLSSNSSLQAPPEQREEGYDYENLEEAKGEGWQYWLAVTTAMIFMLIMMGCLGPPLGFIVWVAAMTFIFIFSIAPEFGFFISLPALLAYTMDK